MRGGLVVRATSLVAGLFLFSCGIVALLESELGLSPWDVLNQGLDRQTALSFGAANTVVGLLVLLAAWALGERPGIGTVANAVLIGVFIDVLIAVPAVSGLDEHGLAVSHRAGADRARVLRRRHRLLHRCGVRGRPPDSLMLVLSRRTGARIGLVRGLLELSVLVVGIVLGGTFGVGTIAFVLLIGPVVEASFALFARSPLAAPGRPVEVIEGR